ncbi:hypothetical protein [Halolamina salifodinae]|uniref:tRNA(Ile2) C34 agmatinyltransferase TiaS n=1 Tax=Halolamina salifodinae TaxID=1202767 RepID=A0A8T4GXC4_9EURY|nr:hypothetical protein [Halolamina salifodinae]MBP1986802.1 tRNA(Ile2) C34 agmatinyltransferase TiaS [Halolamina salifodinae]
MGIVSTIERALTRESNRSDETAETGTKSTGAYWCDDCNVRVRNVDVEAEGLDRDDEGTPVCPDCGTSMRFERSHADGCAC